jgi:hypothetical protein
MNKQNRNPLSIILTILAVMVIFFANNLHAADVTLSWDKPDDSRVIGYKIYCGISGTNFKSTPVQTISSVNQTSCLIPNLEEGQMYDFAATSFDSDNNESAFSETINYSIAALSDADGDGYSIIEGDCNDNNASIHPGAVEICGDGIDQDCNGSDLQCPQSWYKDADTDKYSDGTSLQSVNRPASYYLASELTATSGDCNDNNAAIHPGAVEVCGDGIDQDCNGSDLICPEDIDNDGDGFTENDGDCNDNDANIYPGAIEICGDEIDQNCDGSDLVCISIDGVTLSWTKPDDDRVVGYNLYCGKTGTEFKLTPSLIIYSADTTSYTFTNLEAGFEYSFAATSFDADGNESDFSETITYFVGSSSEIDSDGDGYTVNDGDCNDNDASIYPGAIEICGDGSDQDCDGSDLLCDADPETQTLLFGDTPDSDLPGTISDTFINLNADMNYTGAQLNTYTWPENMPANAILIKFDLSKLPAGAQIQSATLSLYQTEAGGDAAYDVSVHKIINHNSNLFQASGYTYDGVNGWTANNSCYNSIPLAQADIAPAENVNSLDQNLEYKKWNVTGMVQAWVGDSSTNYGLMLNSDVVASSDSYRFFAASEATDPARRPKLEVTYTNVSSGETDNDGDGYTVSDGDCNDNDSTIHPGTVEICGDGIDQDCNGSDLVCPEDIDNDGDGYTVNEGDCNDNSAAIHPGAFEICGDGIDQDCDGSDLQCPQTWYKDTDSDKYSDGTSLQSVNRPASYYLASELTATSGDCNDNSAAIHPGAVEICGDGIDQDCNGSDLQCPQTWYKDVDSDKYSDGTSLQSVNRPASYYLASELTATSGDCNDNSAAIHPGAVEICGDGIDQDCNGSDLQCPQTWYKDVDSDKYSDGTSLQSVNRPASYYLASELTATSGDCNDTNAAIHPGAVEICGDGIDQDCNGSDLQCPQTWYKDVDSDKYSDGTSLQSVNRLASYYLASELTATSGDCDDNNAAIHPGAVEICGDGIDQDCNGSDLICPEDIDNDGDGFTENDGDCNDNDATIYPGAIEICGDSIDQDCDGSDLKCIPEETQDIAMELGEIEINHVWTPVTFDKTFTNPVVVAKPISLNDNAPAVVRIRKVSATGFEIRVQEWNYLDGNHAFETVSYMVMEAGSHTLSTGIKVEAGTFYANSRKKSVRFNQTFNQIPVVISGVTTENERDAVVGRASGISASVFNFVLQEQETTKTRHYTYEKISYIAWEPSSGSVNGMSYIVDSTMNAVTHSLYNIPFYPSFTTSPVFMADMQTANNWDTANVRWQSKNGDGIDVQIDEEQSKDLEVSHIAEVVGYMAFGPSAH